MATILSSKRWLQRLVADGITLENHETTNKHFEAQNLKLELSIHLKVLKTLDAIYQTFWNARNQHWNTIFKVELFGESCFTFVGNYENLYEHDNRIYFLQLVQLILILSKRALNKQHKITTHTSKTIQNEIIHLIALNVKS